MPVGLTIDIYFPRPDQNVPKPPSAPDINTKPKRKPSQWFENASFRTEVLVASDSLDLSWSALQFATRSPITTSVIYELPLSSSSADHNADDVPVSDITPFVQYVPDLVRQLLDYYTGSILTACRRAALSATTQAAPTPQLTTFLNSYRHLIQPRILLAHEAKYSLLMYHVMRAGCELAGVIDSTVVEGVSGWTIEPEDEALNTDMDLVLRVRGTGVLAVELKQINSGARGMRAMEDLTAEESENIVLGGGPGTARAAMRKIALHLHLHKIKYGIITDCASAIVFKLHRPAGATDSILLRSRRIYFFSQDLSLIVLIASILLSRDEADLAITGVTKAPAAFLPTRHLRSAGPPPSSNTTFCTTTAARSVKIGPLTPIGLAESKAAFESEFGIGGVREVGEGVTEDGCHSFVELETAEGHLTLYGEEKKWLEGRDWIPFAGKFSAEALLKAQHLTLVNNFAVFTPTNLQKLTRMRPSHGQLTPPTTPPQPTPSLVLALSSTIFQSNKCTVYATTIEDLKLVVKRLSKHQNLLAEKEASFNSDQLSNFSSDVIPKFFGIYTNEEGSSYLLFEYAGETTTFEKLSQSERTILYSRLEALHARGILHGDFEDRNVVVGSGETDKRTVKIIDFEFSEMHKCEGEECWELKEARFMLGISQDM